MTTLPPVRRLGIPFAVAFLLVAVGWSSAAPAPGWLTFGGDDSRTSLAPSIGTLTKSWFTPLPGMVTTQPLVVAGVPRTGQQTVVVGTAAGYVYALAPNGYVRWRVDLGQQLNSCPQIPDGWGVTGTPVVDLQRARFTSSMRSGVSMHSTLRPGVNVRAGPSCSTRTTGRSSTGAP